MHIDERIRRIIANPTKRRAWIKYIIHMQGRTLSDVARDAGVTRGCLYQVFSTTYPRMEKVVADAVGLPPFVLWPERYDEDGLPIYRMGRPKKSTSERKNDNSRRKLRNVRGEDGNKQRKTG